MDKENDLIDELISDWNSERPELDPSDMQVVGRIILLSKIFEKRAGEMLKTKGVFYTDLDVLATIRRSGAPYELSPKQLMRSVLLTSGAMTAVLNRLEKLKLVYRAQDKSDGRIILAGLTDEGKRVVDDAIKFRFEEAKVSVAALDAGEHRVLSKLLKKLVISLDAAKS